MVGWIAAVLGLFVAQTLIPACLRHYGSGRSFGKSLRTALGPRDEQPPLPLAGERAKRALANMFEALPVFLTLAILIEVEDKASTLAIAGAATFFLARLAYVPAYMLGIYAVRTMFWLVGWGGLLMMLAALFA